MAITALRRIFCGGWRRQRGRQPDGFARDDGGSAAVEFALTAPLFFAAMLSIFEFAVLFGTGVMLEVATNRAARAVRTGQVYTSSLPTLDVNTQALTFEGRLCEGLLFINCEDLSYNIEVFDNFGVADANVFCDADGNITGATQPAADRPFQADFDIGEPAQIVVVTVLYPYKPIIPNPLVYAGQDWESSNGCGGLSMKSVMVFINEPFPKTL